LTDRGTCATPGHPLIAFRSSPESDTPEPAIRGVSSTSDNLPCGSLPLRRFPGSRQPLIPRATNPRVRALPAFLTLSGPCSARDLPALFHAGPVLGVFALQGSSHPRSRTPSRTPLPSCGYPSPGDCVIPVAFPGPPGWAFGARGICIDATPWESGHASGPCSPRVSVPLTGCLSQIRSRDPHGLSPP
jgi:hypothetical protein